MKILFDQGTPVPLRHALATHEVVTVFELGWSELENGALLRKAEHSFTLFITTDQQLRYQQNLAARKLAILVLSTTSWPKIQKFLPEIVAAVEQVSEGEYRELQI